MYAIATQRLPMRNLANQSNHMTLFGQKSKQSGQTLSVTDVGERLTASQQLAF